MSDPTPPPGPTADADRAVLLDRLRGFALTGIAVINVTVFAASYGGPPGFGDSHSPADEWTTAALFLFVESKFFSLFSFLFGVGFAVQLGRADQRGERIGPRYFRRLFALALFGVAHILLLWWGDILLNYAGVGLLLFLFRRVSVRGLVWWAIGLLAVPLLLLVGLNLLLAAARLHPPAAEKLREADAQMLKAFAEESAKDAEKSARSRSFAERTRDQAEKYVGTAILLATRVPTVLAMFLLGLAAGRRGIPADPDAHVRLLRSLAAWTIPVGLIGSTLTVVGMATLPPLSGLLLLFFNQAFNGPVLAIGYAAGFALLTRRLPPTRLAPLAAAGRMALTCYLTQSLVGVLLYEVGGLKNQLPIWAAVGLAFLTMLLLMGASTWWLRRFRFGPMEWLWRWATYLKRPALRRTD